MRRLTRTVAALAVAATPVLGVIAVHADGVLADNGVIHGNGAPGATHTVADNGVIHMDGSVRILADNGVINSRN